ncbi:Putative glycosyltransferase ytcC [Bacteroidales bacterium CF]|nr:Putative glycosyltransferase ytcC [Bacteroidales bacterium CF]
MNIAIITTGILPVPAIKGGAVETLIDILINYNEDHPEHFITIFGTYDKEFERMDFSKYKRTKFVLTNNHSFVTKLRRKIFQYSHSSFFYNYYLDFFAAEVSKKVATGNYDVLISENRPGFVLPLRRAFNGRLFLHLHYDNLYKGVEFAEEVVSACTGVLAVSSYIKQRVCTLESSKNKVNVIYNGIDLEKFTDISELSVTRSQFRLKENDFVIVYTGRIEPIKGIKELLEAFASIKDFPDMKLLIVGSASVNDMSKNQYLEKIYKIASTLGERVIFTGFQPYKNIPAILKFCNLSVIPSTCEEAFPLSAIESLASGLPIIATRSGGMPEAVDSNCSIILEKDGHLTENLRKSIITIYKDKNLQQNMSKHAIEQSKKFSKDNYASNFFASIKITDDGTF